jgi:hypothetical protein
VGAIRKIGAFNHASPIVVGSVVPVNRQFWAAGHCAARLSLYFRAGADASSPCANKLAAAHSGGPRAGAIYDCGQGHRVTAREEKIDRPQLARAI